MIGWTYEHLPQIAYVGFLIWMACVYTIYPGVLP